MRDYLLQCVKRHRGGMAILLALRLSVLALFLAEPFFISRFIDAVVAHAGSRALAPIGVFAALMGSCLVVRIATGRAQILFNETFRRRIENDLQEDLVRTLTAAQLQATRQFEKTYLGRRVQVDTGQIVGFLFSQAIEVGFKVFSIAFYLVAVGHLDAVFLAFLVPGVLLHLCAGIPWRHKLVSSNRAQRESSDRYLSTLVHRLTHIRATQARGLEERMRRLGGAAFQEFLGATRRWASTYAHMEMTLLACRQLVLVAALAYAGWQVLTGNLTVGSLSLVQSYAGSLLGSLAFFPGFVQGLQSASAAWARIAELQSLPREGAKGVQFASLETIEVHGLGIAQNGVLLLDGLSLQFQPGKIYAIVGPSGCGKSSFLDVLMGFRAPSHGEVRVNGVSLRNCDVELLRHRHLGLVAQNEVPVFDSFEENLDPPVGTCSAKPLCERLALTHLGNGHKCGGANLSGGEMLRLALAREFLSTRSALLLDEPTASLDELSSARVLRELEALRAGKIVIVVTHSASLLRCVDEVIDFRSFIPKKNKENFGYENA